MKHDEYDRNPGPQNDNKPSSVLKWDWFSILVYSLLIGSALFFWAMIPALAQRGADLLLAMHQAGWL